jgi:hypothetical protein
MPQVAGRKHRSAVADVHKAWESIRGRVRPPMDGCIAFDLETLRWRDAIVCGVLRRSRLEDFPAYRSRQLG